MASGLDDMLRVTVADTGVGIDKAAQSKLFLPFSQTKAGITQGEGTGLGLAICKLVMEAMGGQIGVDSEGTGVVGRGSTFWFAVKLRRVEDPVLSTLSTTNHDQEPLTPSTPSASTPGPSPPSATPRPSPLLSATLSARSLQLRDPALLRGRSALIAEDNKTNAAVLVRQLKAVGMTVVRPCAAGKPRQSCCS